MSTGVISGIAGYYIGLNIVNRDLTNTDNSDDAFTTNESFINGLYNDLNLTDTNQVFRYVFSHLNNEVVIYPTENYYYFKFPANGKTFWGTIALFAPDRDDGVLSFGYIEKTDKFRKQDSPPIGGGKDYTDEDGVYVKKIGDFQYSVTFDGKTVIFKMNDVGLASPRKAELLDNEIFVGPAFDESGLKFFLIFNNETQHLYWFLNEDGFVPESFSHYTDDIIIGDRTEFAFYLDKENDRKILIGVEGINVLQNNWYDGPFDQMPDNYVYAGKIETKKYLEAAYPGVKIDKYGRYLDEEGTRIAVAPYLVYFSKDDLVSVVDSCRFLTSSNSEFYTCITQQVYDVPEELLEIYR